TRADDRQLTAQAAINEGFDATYIPSYGPESRGGTSYADIHVATDEVLSPSSPSPHVLVAFNAPSLEKFGPAVQPGGLVLYDASVVAQVPQLDPSVRVLGVPFTQMAVELGRIMVKNVVAWGALQARASCSRARASSKPCTRRSAKKARCSGSTRRRSRWGPKRPGRG
ncbi:MAG: hypothetical protein HC897_15385, partial [Thermoanaerobaculia bacterium]|nr:hypothetical protein [Thermoanaerobaculia bacterium]